MGKRSHFVSLILLVLFGLNILAEAASNHVEPVNLHSTSIQSSDAQLTTLHSTTDCPDGQHSDSSRHCADPCHTGRCHFGHCHHMVTGYSPIDPALIAQCHITYELLVPKAPFLDGLKRPPRYS